MRFHFAFAVTDARAEEARLTAAGATAAEVVTPPDGSLLIMMRDPWGVPVQLCQRAQPFDIRNGPMIAQPRIDASIIKISN